MHASSFASLDISYPSPQWMLPSQSYSPYTRCPSGVALITRGGRVFCGSYTENAAHNPGLAPMQAAIAGAVIGGLGDYMEVRRVAPAAMLIKACKTAWAKVGPPCLKARLAKWMCMVGNACGWHGQGIRGRDCWE